MLNRVSGNSSLFEWHYRKSVERQNDTMARLASGRKILRGSDDPAGLISATDLEAAIAALDGESRALQRVQANANIVDGHLSELAGMVSDLRGHAVAAANSGALSDEELAAHQMEIDALATSIQRFAGDAVESLDGIALPDSGNAELADALSQAAGGLASLTSSGTNSLRSGNLEDMLGAIDTAAAAFAGARGTVGSYQKNTVETRMYSLAVERENLLSAHSQIMDADYAVETSNLVRAQIATEAGARVLRVAQHNAQLVFGLLAE